MSVKKEILSKWIHDLWMGWAKAVYPEVSPERQARWDQYLVPYEDLSEEVKDIDRDLADGLIAVLQDYYAKLESRNGILTPEEVQDLSLVRNSGNPWDL